jgi:SET domain-containing protein
VEDSSEEDAEEVAEEAEVEEADKVASCKCRAGAGRRACVGCLCSGARWECGVDCGCGGRCPNGPIRVKKTMVAPSTILGAGDGCFATRDIAKGELVEEYRGRVMPAQVAIRQRPQSAYLADLDSPGRMVVDGESSKVPVTRANHPGGTRVANVVAVKRKVRVEGNTRLSGSLFLKAVKKIHKDEEIFWDYGPLYPIAGFN